MKNIALILLLICPSISLLGQEEENIDLIEVDTSWGQEIFTFPLGFAQEIKYTGVEDARFPADWAKKDSTMYWSYAFVWSIDHDGTLTEEELESNIELYFNGLMSVNGTDIKPANALFMKQSETGHLTKYLGKVNTHDRFFTKERMSLYAKIDFHYCKVQKKSNILFRFSPKDYSHSVWTILEDVKLFENICDH